MTSWAELAFTVVGWFALVFSVFWLGRMWERDHAKPCERWHLEFDQTPILRRDAIKRTPPPMVRVRRGPYDWRTEN